MIFLAQFNLRTSCYMQEDNISTVIRLVEADSEKEAEIKIYKEYEVDYFDYEDNSKSFNFEYNYSEKNYIDEILITPMIK